MTADALSSLSPILRCPDDQGALRIETPSDPKADAELVCAACHRRFPYIGGIAFLLPLGYEARIRAEVKEFYENFGWTKRDGRYEDTLAFASFAPILGPLHRARGERVYDPVKALSGDWFVDVGCGANPAADAGRGFRCHVCVDFALPALRECQAKLGDRGFYIVADAARLPFASNSASFVHAAHCIYHIDAEAQPVAVEELRRILMPGGRGMVQYASPFSPGYIFSLHWLEFAFPPLHRALCGLRDFVRSAARLRRRKEAHTLYFRPLNLGRLCGRLPPHSFRAEVFALFDDRWLGRVLSVLPARDRLIRLLARLETRGRFALAVVARHVTIHIFRGE